MSFSENFEAAKNLAMEAAQTAAAKAKELAAVAKANISIYAEEDKVKKAEIELGKLYYRDYAVGEELDSAEYLPWCQKIDESKKSLPRPKTPPPTTILRSLSPTRPRRPRKRPKHRKRPPKRPLLKKHPRRKNNCLKTGVLLAARPFFV